MSWQIARCKKNKYHDLTCVHEDRKAKVEMCIYCGHREIFRKVDGKTDNVRYLKMHVRNFAQPYGATRKVFGEIWGKAKLQKFDRTIDKSRWRLGKNELRAKQHAETMDFYNTLGQSSS